MATITEPMALDKTFNTTETTPRSQADVLAAIENAIRQGFGRSAADVSYDNTTSGLTADDVQEAIDELAAEKVDKVEGKGLSSNDFTDEDKAALDNMELDIESTQTVSGNPLTLTDCAPINAESLVVELEPKQEGSGDPSPTNVRPITGYTECEVDTVGKNRVEETISDTSIDVDGAIVLDSRYDMHIAKVKQGVQYVVTTNDGGLVAGFFTEKPTFGSVSYNGARVDVVSTTFTAPINGYIAFRTYADYVMPQCEEGITATTYEPYHSSNATIQFGQTVFGGRSNFTDGGTDDEIAFIKDTHITNISEGSDGNADWLNVVFTIDIDILLSDTVEHRQILASRSMSNYSGDWEYENVNGHVHFYSGPRAIYAFYPKSVFPTLSDFTTYYASNKAEFAIPYETISTIATPPTDLKLLQGTNNISTNGTTINLGYQPDNVIGEVKGEIEKCAVDAEFMQFTDGTDTFTDVNLSLDASLHTVSVVDSKIEQKRFICFEVMDKMGGVLQGILASCIAFTDGAKTPSGTAFRAYIESLQMYVNFRIYGSGGSYTLAYQSESSFSASAFYVRVRMMNNL